MIALYWRAIGLFLLLLPPGGDNIAHFNSTPAEYAGATGIEQEDCPAIATQPSHSQGDLLGSDFEARLIKLLDEADSVPGLAIAVVKGNEVAYVAGFGYRNLQSCAPVTSDTRFYLKSTTKSFLGVLAAQLHEEGAIELDAPITDYLPELAPPGVNASHLTIRDHLTHTIPYFDSGLNYKSAFVGMDRSEYVPHINTYARSTNTRFQYSNVGPIVAAHAIESATQTSWRDLIELRIFRPLGMRSSFTYIHKAEAGPFATAYRVGDQTRFQETTAKHESQMHAAGGAVSSVNDLSRWLIASLNAGMIDGKQALSRHAFEQAHARQVNLDRTYYKFHRFAHGFGHYSAMYEEDLLVHHFGGETHVSFMPEHQIGIVVLSNQIEGGATTTHRIAALAYDHLLGKQDLDERWDAAKVEITESFDELSATTRKRITEIRDSAPNATVVIEPAALVGTFSNSRLGDIAIQLTGSALAMEFGAQSGVVEPVQGNAYLAYFAPWNGLPELFVFERDERSDLILDWGGRRFVRSE